MMLLARSFNKSWMMLFPGCLIHPPRQNWRQSHLQQFLSWSIFLGVSRSHSAYTLWPLLLAASCSRRFPTMVLCYRKIALWHAISMGRGVSGGSKMRTSSNLSVGAKLIRNTNSWDKFRHFLACEWSDFFLQIFCGYLLVYFDTIIIQSIFNDWILLVQGQTILYWAKSCHAGDACYCLSSGSKFWFPDEWKIRHGAFRHCKTYFFENESDEEVLELMLCMLLYLFRIEIWTYYSDTIAFRVLFLGVNDNLCFVTLYSGPYALHIRWSVVIITETVWMKMNDLYEIV